MASLARLISSLKPQSINPSSHKLLGFNYLSTQLTLKLSPTHQPFYSTTRPSNYFTTTAAYAGRHLPNTRDNSSKKLSNCITNPIAYPSSHKLLGFNYSSTQLTLELSPTHQPFYSTTRSSNYFTTAAAYNGSSPHNPCSPNYSSEESDDEDDEDEIVNSITTGDDEDKIVNRPCVYTIKLEEPGGTKKNNVNSITTGVCMLWPKEKNFHFGEHDYVSVRGQCLNSEDTYLNVIGGSGIFKGVQGKVKLQKICIEAPVKLFYLEGIKKIAE